MNGPPASGSRAPRRLPIVIGLATVGELGQIDTSGLREFFDGEFRSLRRRYPHSPLLALTRSDGDVERVARAAAKAAEIATLEFGSFPSQGRDAAQIDGTTGPFGVLGQACHVLITVERSGGVRHHALGDDGAVNLLPEFAAEVIQIRLDASPDKPTYSLSKLEPQRNASGAGKSSRPSDQAMQRTDKFNRDAANAEQTQSHDGSDTPLQALFGAADGLANTCQKKLGRAFHAVFWLAILTTGFYGAFSEFDKNTPHIDQYVLVPYLLMLVAAYAVYYVARRSDIHNRYVEYRALAEGMRVQCHWAACGIRRNVADFYLDRHPTALHWIRLALRSATLLTAADSVAPAPGSDAIREVLRSWISEQRSYFTSTLEKARHREKLARNAVRVIFVLGGFATLVSLLQSQLKPFVPYLKEFGFLSILCPAVATAVIALVGKLGVLYQVQHYSRMLDIYSQAERYLAPGVPASAGAVAMALGQEALRESGDWLLFRRDRGIEEPSSPFRRPSW